MITNETQTKEYVKGYGIDWDKVKAALEITDDGDGRIRILVQKILEHVDCDIHWTCIGKPNSGKRNTFNIISFGKEAFDTDPEALRKKDIPAPDYLKSFVEPFFVGPDVFEVVDW
ncbi:hypothetical protein E1B28_012247 [Marasmius oreades]|uniref:Uncharacterized protein n=1 Tax=Marasmius oreades TaxID=181124 RepID=A0A9P7RR86_9AGAR|nr:uncharacterized protein E1B28_012247 [Marasmius oreades]KAG7088230.1 hypothetical protein E1B28_012247 [Marasmius oreades]